MKQRVGTKAWMTEIKDGGNDVTFYDLQQVQSQQPRVNQKANVYTTINVIDTSSLIKHHYH